MKDFFMSMPSPHDRLVAGRARSPAKRFFQALLVLLPSLGCTEFEAGSDVRTDGEVRGLGPAPTDPAWRCLTEASREPALLPVFAGTAERVVLSLQVIDLSTGQVYPDARVRACGIADLNCEAPVTDRLAVDSNGWVDLPLFRNFTGFLEVESAGTVPYLLYLTEPVARSTTEYPLTVISRASLSPLVQLVGVPLQVGTGVLAVRAFDCDGNTVSGISISTSTDGVPWYFIDGLPSGIAEATGTDGLGGYVNVPPSLAVVDALVPEGFSIAGPQSVVVREGWLTSLYLRPPGSRPPE